MSYHLKPGYAIYFVEVRFSETVYVLGNGLGFTGKPEKPRPSGRGGIGRHATRAMWLLFAL